MIRLIKSGLVAVMLALSMTMAHAQLPAKVGDTPLPSLAPIIKRTSPAVVGIAVRGTIQTQINNPLLQDPFFRRFFDIPEATQQFQASGSGVIVDAQQGYIVTNAHVIENARDITVTLIDGRELKNAQIKGVDRASDIAVLQVKSSNLTALTMADSSKIQVGDFVIAIGNPFGLEHTVTSGIISALGRGGIVQDGYEDFIQTDAAINPGNSGGALLDLNGQLVGINSAIISNTGSNAGIGFAIPANMVKAVMDQLIKFGKVQRGELGIRMTAVGDAAGSVGADSVESALISEVIEGSPAEHAGLKPGDVITTINGRPVKSTRAVRNAIGLLRVGETVEIGVLRDGKPRKLTATIGTRGEGILTAGMHQGLAGAEFADTDGEGALVTAVADNSNAANNGLQRNDLIIAVGRMRVTNVKQLREAVKGSNSFLMTIQRGDRQLVAVIR
ncbi:MAG TPA: Do family serine endopeptidase [Steroidobacteraceae bacterium]|nr:Do family serine endopeptidase [Steroidobacteraceae bacterium]